MKYLNLKIRNVATNRNKLKYLLKLLKVKLSYTDKYSTKIKGKLKI